MPVMHRGPKVAQMSQSAQSSVTDQITGAVIVTHRRLEWADTDAAGHNHFTVAFRWMEEAEFELRRSVGLPHDLTGGVPRVHIEVDYRDRIWFGEEVTITLGVVEMGRSSCRFAWRVDREDGAVLIEGSHVVVYAPDAHSGAVAWPEEYRQALLGVQ